MATRKEIGGVLIPPIIYETDAMCIQKNFDDLFVITFGYVAEKLSDLISVALEYLDIAIMVPKSGIWLIGESFAQVYLF